MNFRPLLIIAVCLAATSSAFGQGSLTPPGAPGATMKTLDQIESRTPIPGGSAPYTISASGSYYLTGNITVATGDIITITAANVTLDLNGFNLATTSATPSGTAVKISGRRTTVCNGTVSGSGSLSGATFNGGGFLNGVIWTGAIPQSITVRDVLVTGCSAIGIKASLVERCVLQNIGANGITGTIVRACQVDPCGGTAIYAQIASDCIAAGYVTGISGGTALNCTGTGTTGTGLTCAAAQNCSGTTLAGDGTTAGIGVTTASNCVGTSYTAAAGLKAEIALGSQGTSDSGLGLVATTASTSKGVSDSSTGLSIATGDACFGQTDTGLFGANAGIVANSFGYATSNVPGNRGFDASTAINCAGRNAGAGPGLNTTISTGCYGVSDSGTVGISTILSIGSYVPFNNTISSSYHYNQP